MLWEFKSPRPHQEPPDITGGSYNFCLRKRRALPITETEERLMAAPAIMGESSSPNTLDLQLAAPTVDA